MAWSRHLDYVVATDPGVAEERRNAIRHAEEEREALRQRELAAQSSPQNGAQVRIAMWERLHALRLPRSADHPLVRLISRQTGLDISEVRDEQGRRALISR